MLQPLIVLLQAGYYAEPAPSRFSAASTGMFFLIIAIGIVGYIVQARLQSVFKKYSKVQFPGGLTGAEVAEKMLRDNNIHNVKVTHVPSTGEGSAELDEERNSPDGSVTSSMPSPLISKQPTSSVGPKRFFTARSIRNAVSVSPSNWQTTSTKCSNVRGPAIDPSLVT